MSIKTDSGPLNVFVPASCDTFSVANGAQPGKSIKVTGKLQTYNGEKEIVADSVSNI